MKRFFLRQRKSKEGRYRLSIKIVYKLPSPRLEAIDLLSKDTTHASALDIFEKLRKGAQPISLLTRQGDMNTRSSRSKRRVAGPVSQ